MGLSRLLKKPDPAALARQAAADARQAEIVKAIQKKRLPKSMRERLTASRDGTSPWIATLSAAELRIARSHGIRPIAAVSATCWLHYGYSWTNGHAQGWKTAVRRLREEAMAAGANAVLDVKMRTLPLAAGSSMDFSLVGTAVKVDGLPPSTEPVIATVSALEFVRLLEADIVSVGIAVGAKHQWMNDWRGSTKLFWAGNTECAALSRFLSRVRRQAYDQLSVSADKQGSGTLAHVNFTQMFEREGDPKQYLCRHIVVATIVDTPERTPIPQNFQMAVDMHAGKTPLRAASHRHQSYASNEQEGAL